MESMGTLQPDLPPPSSIPKNYSVIVITLQVCFFTIPFYPRDCQHFAFSLPSPNFWDLIKGTNRKLYHIGPKTSPTLCPKFVDATLLQIHKKYSNVFLWSTWMTYWFLMLIQPISKRYYNFWVNSYGLRVPTPKRSKFSLLFLFEVCYSHRFRFAPIMNGPFKNFKWLWKAAWRYNWVHSYIEITMAVFKPLFVLLQGDPNPTSPWKLTCEAKTCLALKEEKLNSQNLLCVDYNNPRSLEILCTEYTLTACLWQIGY